MPVAKLPALSVDTNLERTYMTKIDFKPKARLWSSDACVWEVPSSTESGVIHIVAITSSHAEPHWVCSCKAFQFRHRSAVPTCKHVNAVLLWKDAQQDARQS